MTYGTRQIRYTGITHVDDVIVVVTLIDSFTGQIIKIDPEDVELCNAGGVPLLKRAIQNPTGRLVFMRSSRIVDGVKEEIEQEESEYKIKINARNVGYFDPEDQRFPPVEEENRNNEINRQMTITLNRIPAVAPPVDATLISGVIYSQGDPAPGTKILAQLPEEILPPNNHELPPFEAQSDERGAFVLAMRLPPEAKTSEEKINFNFSYNGNDRDIEVSINRTKDGKLIRIISDAKQHSFMEPIELTNDEIPELKVFGE